MIKEPRVSIICTNFNKGDWIKDALNSFLDQKANFDFEIIVIDDASTDNSPRIIKEYVDKYPDRILALYNKKNLGIIKTWKEACSHAKGKYIAKCDGDDFWIDPQKLQKQVDVLEGASDSQWSSTDFNIILPDGKVTDISAFENGILRRAQSYEHLLATKGFTMASTWLVETKLMLSINAVLDENYIDDTFPIQIELFHRTKLKYIPQPMVAYRVGYQSDSKPVDLDKLKLRYNSILATQLKYIDKYQDADFIEMLKFAVRANTNIEEILADTQKDVSNKNHIIEQQQTHIKEQEKLIKEQEKLIKEQEKVITNIVNSKRYRFVILLARPAAFIKWVKDGIKHS